jgi:3'-phosphoadenosine 5'-phosphosulfate sulfotransferase (PAPS reductase)/FAD synthetase
MDLKHIVFYSGGLGSWMTAKRVIEKYGKDNVILLFTDTLSEDKDLYRFIEDTEKNFGIPVTTISDGRDIWQIFKDARFLGNSRIAPCTSILKQKLSKKWVKENFKPDECILYLGIDWTEMHRTEAPRRNWAPYRVEYPMCEVPYLDKEDVRNELKRAGIELPYLYKIGMSHNNCNGMCVKGGQGHWIQLLKASPERFAEAEQKEKEMQEFLQRDVTILKRTKDGQQENLSLEQLRKEYESEPEQLDLFDIGGCGCFSEYGEEDVCEL